MVTLALPHKGGEACNGDVHAAGSSAKQLTYVTSDGMARCRRRTRCLPTMSLAYRQALIEMADAVDCNARIVHCFLRPIAPLAPNPAPSLPDLGSEYVCTTPMLRRDARLASPRAARRARAFRNRGRKP